MTSPAKPSLLILTGPTGSGKSAVAHRLAERFNLRIISADSRQVIKGFDIGSAKPTPAERKRFDYRGLDLIEPGERFSAFNFQEMALAEIRSALRDGVTPIVCGGTGLYIRALTEGIFEIPDGDPEIRRQLEREAKELTPTELHDKLRRIDPLSAELIHPHNVVRVMRALEIYYLTGKSKSELAHSQRLTERPYEFRQLALAPPIQHVYEWINQRVDAMISSGWVEEVRQLIERYGPERIKKAKTIGYTELAEYALGERNSASALEKTKRETRRFAKRQMTWLRGSHGIEFFETAVSVEGAAEEFLLRQSTVNG